jgi:hypothetical protein
MKPSSPSRTPENGARKAISKSRRDRILILVFLLIVVQVTSFLVFGFAQSKMTDHMPHLFSSKATFEEVREVNIRLKGMQDSIDGLRRDAESLKLLKGEIQEMKRYMDGALSTSTNNDNQALQNNTKMPKGENPVGEGATPNIKGIRKGKDIQRYKNKYNPNIKKGKGKDMQRYKQKYNRSLLFLHIGKNGGTSFDSLGRKVAAESQYNYVGNRHFDWNEIEKKGQLGKDAEVVLLLRHPVSRAFSHFNFYKKQGFSKKMKIRSQNLTAYLFDGDKQNLLNTRDVWQDGQASVSWLTGTHIANWVGCPKGQVEARERRARNSTAMCYLAAARLQQVKWFGILEDLGRSMELLQHEFNLTDIPKMGHSNNGGHGHAKPTTEEVKALESLMPQDLWLYEYGKRLFEARWEEYKTGVYTAPEYPPLPDPFPCLSTRFELNCTSGTFAGNFQGKL